MSEDEHILSALRQSLRMPDVPPRRSPHLEALLEQVEEARAARLNVEQALAAVAQMQQRLARARADLDGNVAGGELPATQLALVERLRRLYHENDSALADLSAAVGSSDFERASAVGERLRRITQQLFECHDAWLAEQRDSSVGMAMVPTAFGKLYEASDQVASGAIPREQWRAVLDEVERNLTSERGLLSQGLADMAAALREDSFSQSLAENLERSLDDCLVALACMRHYEGDGDPSHLNQGWNDLVSGLLRFQHSLRLLQSAQQSSADMVIMDADD